jgi:hypothetical protein
MGRVDEKIGGKEMAKNKQCSVEGCTNPHKSRGYCNKHYLQALSRGEIKTERKSWNSKKKEIASPLARNDKKAKDNPSPVIAREPKQSQTNGNYTITIDFSRYPKIHERLINLAHEEFRTPEFQLMHMLNQKFQQMEGEACQ